MRGVVKGDNYCSGCHGGGVQGDVVWGMWKNDEKRTKCREKLCTVPFECFFNIFSQKVFDRIIFRS